MTTSQSTGITPASSESLESDLLAHLASTTALDDLHATLLCSLQRMGWTEKVRKLSQELLRGGRCERFDDVVEAVVASAEGRKHPVLAGLDNVNEEDKNSNGDADGYFEKVDVRIPEAVVEQGVRAIKEVLREVVVLDDDSDLLEHHDSRHSNVDGKPEGGGETKTKPSKSSKTGDQSLKNGDTSPVKKTDKKPKPGKQIPIYFHANRLESAIVTYQRNILPISYLREHITTNKPLLQVITPYNQATGPKNKRKIQQTYYCNQQDYRSEE